MASSNAITPSFSAQPFHLELTTEPQGTTVADASEALLHISQAALQSNGLCLHVQIATILCSKKENGNLVTLIVGHPQTGENLVLCTFETNFHADPPAGEQPAGESTGISLSYRWTRAYRRPSAERSFRSPPPTNRSASLFCRPWRIWTVRARPNRIRRKPYPPTSTLDRVTPRQWAERFSGFQTSELFPAIHCPRSRQCPVTMGQVVLALPLFVVWAKSSRRSE
jgi:hypothetical protein